VPTWTTVGTSEFPRSRLAHLVHLVSDPYNDSDTLVVQTVVQRSTRRLIDAPSLRRVQDTQRTHSQQKITKLQYQEKWRNHQLSQTREKSTPLTGKISRISNFITTLIYYYILLLHNPARSAIICHGMSILKLKWQQISFLKEYFLYIQKTEFIVHK